MPALQLKLRRFLLGWRRSGRSGFFHELRECRGVLHRDIREYFTVERDAGSLEAVDQLAIRQPVVSRGGAHALNPQAGILALLDAAVAFCVAVGAIGGFPRRFVELAPGYVKASWPL